MILPLSYKAKLADSLRSPIKVSERYVSIIGKETVDILPTEISELYYYGLNYHPRPIPQSYSVYDEYLDTKNAEKIMDPSGPQYILYDNQTIDNRHPFWDESITKRALISHYELAVTDSSLKAATRFNEEIYLKRNPDVAKAVLDGIYKTGYDHYVKEEKKAAKL
jgi:hypothetical protein